jgi:flagellar biosynthesis anti-sigma factor FlgM
MRIGLNTPDPQSVSAEQAKKSSTTATTTQPAPTSTSDKTALTHDRVTLSALASQALGLPEVRQATVDSLRQSINNGQYRLDSNESADAILRNRQNSRQ